jgi:hypothetical protein
LAERERLVARELQRRKCKQIWHTSVYWGKSPVRKIGNG